MEIGPGSSFFRRPDSRILKIIIQIHSVGFPWYLVLMFLCLTCTREHRRRAQFLWKIKHGIGFEINFTFLCWMQSARGRKKVGPNYGRRGPRFLGSLPVPLCLTWGNCLSLSLWHIFVLPYIQFYPVFQNHISPSLFEVTFCYGSFFCSLKFDSIRSPFNTSFHFDQKAFFNLLHDIFPFPWNYPCWENIALCLMNLSVYILIARKVF